MYDALDHVRRVKPGAKPDPEVTPKVPLCEVWDAMRQRAIQTPVAIYPASPQLVSALRYRVYRRLERWGLREYYRVETHPDHLVIVPKDVVRVRRGSARERRGGRR